MTATLLRILGASRPLSWVNTAFPFLAAYLVTGGSMDTRFYLGTFFFLIPYNIAMYGINDVFDFESDILNPRKGGVEGTVLAREHHRTLLWAAAISCVPFVVYLYTVGTRASGIWLTISLFALLAYSVPGLRFKERPFLDSVTSSVHFVSPALIAGTMSPGGVNAWFTWCMVAFFLWGTASHALGAIQDVTADRQGGLSSIATVLGAGTTARLVTAQYLVAALILFLLPHPSWIAGLVILPYAVNSARFWTITDATCTRARSGWSFFLYINFVAGSVLSITMLWVGLR